MIYSIEGGDDQANSNGTLSIYSGLEVVRATQRLSENVPFQDLHPKLSGGTKLLSKETRAKKPGLAFRKLLEMLGYQLKWSEEQDSEIRSCHSAQPMRQELLVNLWHVTVEVTKVLFSGQNDRNSNTEAKDPYHSTQPRTCQPVLYPGRVGVYSSHPSAQPDRRHDLLALS